MPSKNAAWIFLIFTAACAGGGSSSSNTGPTSPTPTNPGTPVSQTGCSVTYQCPNVDANGVANPSTPTFDQLTLTTGTSDSCRADVLRNPSSPTVPIQFTIRNAAPNTPAASYFWSVNTGPDMMSTSPPSGQTTTAGPFQATAQFSNFSGSISSGQNLTETLELDIHNSGASGTSIVARCGVTVFGFVKPGG